MSDRARIRPLAQSEVDEYKRLRTTCRCWSPPTYALYTLETRFHTRSYRQATGKRDTTYEHKQVACIRCASKFATENKLALPPAPRPEPRIGEKWRETRNPEFVVTIVGMGEKWQRPAVEVVPNHRGDHLVPTDHFLENFELVEAT